MQESGTGGERETLWRQLPFCCCQRKEALSGEALPGWGGVCEQDSVLLMKASILITLLWQWSPTLYFFTLGGGLVKVSGVTWRKAKKTLLLDDLSWLLDVK